MRSLLVLLIGLSLWASPVEAACPTSSSSQILTGTGGTRVTSVGGASIVVSSGSIGVCSCDGGGTDAENGTCLQTALNTATGGDIIKLACGKTYQSGSSFTLPIKAISSPIQITVENACLASLPNSTTRLHPVTHAAGLARLKGTGANPTLTGANGVHHYTLGPGLEITNAGTHEYYGGLLTLDGDFVSGTNLVIDRIYVHPIEVTTSSLHPTTNADGTPNYLAGWPVVPLATTTQHALTVYGLTGVVVKNSVLIGGGYQGALSSVTLASIGFVSCAGNGATVQNNHLEAIYSPAFLGGCGASSKTAHTATILASPSPTLTSARLSSCTDLAVNDLVAFKLRNSADENTGLWGVGRIATIDGSCTVTWTRLKGDNPTWRDVTCLIDNPGGYSGGATTIHVDTCDYTGVANPYVLFVSAAYQDTEAQFSGHGPYNLANGTYTFTGGETDVVLQTGLSTSVADNTAVTFDPDTGWQDFDIAPPVGQTAQWEGWLAEDFHFLGNRFVTLNESVAATTPVKGAFEIKVMRGGSFIGNVFFSTTGADVFFYPQNQVGDLPWADTSNITLRYNVFLLAARCAHLPNGSSYNVTDDTAANILYEHNLCLGDSASAYWNGSQRAISQTAGTSHILRHNTFAMLSGTRWADFYQTNPPVGMTVENNILGGMGYYDAGCDGAGNWPTGDCDAGLSVYRRNLFMDNRDPAGGYPQNHAGTDGAWPNLYAGHDVDYIKFTTPGVWNGAINNPGGYSVGATSLVVDGMPSGRTLLAGHRLYVGSTAYAVGANVTFSGGGGTITLASALAENIPDNQTVTIIFGRTQRAFNMQVLASSPGYQAATDGTAIGANVSLVYGALSVNGGVSDWPFTWIP